MFGMGFMEIFLIAIVAIIALGPEKLPTAMVEIAKFLKKFKSGVEDAKSTLDNELNITEMKAEAAKYKAQIEDAKSTLNIKENMDLNLDNIINDEKETDNTNDEKPKEEKVSLKKPKKKKKKEEKIEEAVEEKPKEESSADKMNKFKVDFDELEDDK
ncbi:Sec-independent protein translocase protein TatB [Arcobacter sp. LA11]|uniref:Sec-independent protein translocase protein TatB n=1 Tax=Arcobacter sp. LA11 TaxID=1898176 RepID=UPI00093339F1|nr:Sec-independent protein translocase protein TatB [Arcobacter sp. LA11]